MDWMHMDLKKRKLLLIVSVVVMLQLVFYGIRDVYEVCDRFSKEPISEETYVSEKLPPGTKVIHTGHRYGSIQRNNSELIGGAIMKFVLGVGFFVWCLLKYLEEKRLTEEAERQLRKKREIETNLMLDKEKRLAKYRGDGKDNDREKENAKWNENG